jgi:hypothetical protein
MKKEVKMPFDYQSLGDLFNSIAQDIKEGYFSIGDTKIPIPGSGEVEIEYKEVQEGGKTKCVMEWEFKWYKD